MNILVLNGSPRPNGNTARLVTAFKDGAESAGHVVTVVDVCRKNIKGCIACEYCHTKGHGNCIQKDDFVEIANALEKTEVLVLASPIYYHNISGQLKCVIDRFYAPLYPKAPKSLTKIAMLLCSGDPNMYAGAEFSFKGDFIGYLGLENVGEVTISGGVTSQNLDQARIFGASL